MIDIKDIKWFIDSRRAIIKNAPKDSVKGKEYCEGYRQGAQSILDNLEASIKDFDEESQKK